MAEYTPNSVFHGNNFQGEDCCGRSSGTNQWYTEFEIVWNKNKTDISVLLYDSIIHENYDLSQLCIFLPQFDQPRWSPFWYNVYWQFESCPLIVHVRVTWTSSLHYSFSSLNAWYHKIDPNARVTVSFWACWIQNPHPLQLLISYIKDLIMDIEMYPPKVSVTKYKESWLTETTQISMVFWCLGKSLGHQVSTLYGPCLTDHP